MMMIKISSSFWFFQFSLVILYKTIFAILKALRKNNKKYKFINIMGIVSRDYSPIWGCLSLPIIMIIMLIGGVIGELLGVDPFACSIFTTILSPFIIIGVVHLCRSVKEKIRKKREEKEKNRKKIPKSILIYLNKKADKS